MTVTIGGDSYKVKKDTADDIEIEGFVETHIFCKLHVVCERAIWRANFQRYRIVVWMITIDGSFRKWPFSCEALPRNPSNNDCGGSDRRTGKRQAAETRAESVLARLGLNC